MSAGSQRRGLVTAIGISDVVTVGSNVLKGKTLTCNVYAVLSEVVVRFADPVVDAVLIYIIETYMYRAFTYIDGLNKRRITDANMFLLWR